MKKRIIPVLVAVVLIVLIAIAGLGYMMIQKYSYSTQRADLKEYFEIKSEEEVPIILQDEIIPERAKLWNGIYYVDFDTVQKYFNSRFYFDYNEKLLLYTLPMETVTVPLDGKEFTVNGQTKAVDYAIVMYQGDTVYVAMDYVKQFTNFSYEAFTEPNRMQVFTKWGDINTASINKDTSLRIRGGVKSEILNDLLMDETVVILEEMENWSKVKTKDALIGYVENKRLKDKQTISQVPVAEYVEPEYASISKDHKINLVWHQVTNMSANDNMTNLLANTKSVNVISPTWFFLNDNNGNFASLASSNYVNQAHAAGIEVWALLENITYKNQIDLHEILSFTSKRKNLVQNLINTVVQYDIDGINVDLESVQSNTGQAYIQFIRELSVACRANGIVLSVDNYVPKEYSSHYNRKEQGIFADYVIIMGYDEHWHGSKDPGSVASIGFVEEGIQKTVEEVPAHKVINAVPFYTNIWKSAGGDITDEQVGMATAEAFLRNRGIEAAWDEETCQNYAEFVENDTTYQVWLEDEKSIEVKCNIMKNYGIAGIASWKLGLEKASIWDTISNYVNGQ